MCINRLRDTKFRTLNHAFYVLRRKEAFSWPPNLGRNQPKRNYSLMNEKWLKNFQFWKRMNNEQSSCRSGRFNKINYSLGIFARFLKNPYISYLGSGVATTNSIESACQTNGRKWYLWKNSFGLTLICKPNKQTCFMCLPRSGCNSLENWTLAEIQW